eukprot:CAMPEP_0114590814 /NCGR_PEP_ID=MMETSP0125-20121206/12995_1 /TAXON_ID=485358 ORGANISM="Aristerostoma sp., Strain ATCC 50986" /NCGR_SAMPLE_ID=MMETSP0125 /ASSEMBLY_ACC=CAM_ASM_000245 /LENGTH=68 /DNA_ID=CAMNT_0001788543 /DNA_START=95 /DNA_END=301 /DNA_ORIENTATION=-
MPNRMHGSLARAGKVRKQTPKIEKKEKIHKVPKGRAKKRVIINRRFINVDPTKKRRSPNWNAGQKELK